MKQLTLVGFFRAFFTKQEIRRHLSGGKVLKLHIGCGTACLPGWLNLDQRPIEGAFWLDARAPLPFPSGSVHRIFHEHFLEHLSFEEGQSFVQECARVLTPEGRMRVSTPDLELLLASYQDKNSFVTLEEALRRHERLRGHPEGITAARFLNDKMRCWGHQFIYDFETLSQQLQYNGFDEITRAGFGRSSDPELCGLEQHADVPWMRDAEPLIVEARKAPIVYQQRMART